MKFDVMSVLLAVTTLLTCVCGRKPELTLIKQITSSQIDNTAYFLPNTTVPHHYDIVLNLNIGPIEYNYLGYVRINISVLEFTDTIILHSDQHHIIAAMSSVQNDTNTMEIVTYRKHEWFLVLNLSSTIQPGDYQLVLVYEGRYFDNGGLMMKSYNSPVDGVRRHLLATHFEPVFARQMFPCFDEPNLKATFQLIVFHPPRYHVISNVNVLSVQAAPLEDKLQTIFEVTPKMSTYLVALAITEFDGLVANYKNISFKMYVEPGQQDRAEFALTVTKASFIIFENLLNVNYSLPKLDSLVLSSFNGGMENWGLIVYDDVVLLDPSNATDTELMATTELVCHEVVHQWFGNLVTLDWWDYTWMNEGFAMYYSEICGDLILGNTESRRFMHTYIVDLQQMLIEDSMPSTMKSLNKHIAHPLLLWSKFDSYAYQKGAAMVRLMSFAFPNFNQAMTKYLNRFKYANVKPEDLFGVLNEGATLPIGLNVAKIMKNWVNLPGYPLITFNITRRGNISRVVLTQEQFSMVPLNVTGKWWIPISIVSESDPDFSEVRFVSWIPETRKSVQYFEGIANGWVIINTQAAVFCRVNYDLENWKMIIAYLKGPNFQKIHVLNRAQLIDDANNLAKTNKLPESVVLELLGFIKQETDPLIFRTAKKVVLMYNELLKNTRVYPKFLAFAADIYGVEQANEILGVPDFYELVAKVLDIMPIKQSTAFEEFDDIVGRVFTQTDLTNVEAASGSLLRSDMRGKINQIFLKKVEARGLVNNLIYENFTHKQKNYGEVSDWLEQRY